MKVFATVILWLLLIMVSEYNCNILKHGFVVISLAMCSAIFKQLINVLLYLFKVPLQEQNARYRKQSFPRTH